MCSVFQKLHLKIQYNFIKIFNISLMIIQKEDRTWSNMSNIFAFLFSVGLHSLFALLYFSLVH